MTVFISNSFRRIDNRPLAANLAAATRQVLARAERYIRKYLILFIFNEYENKYECMALLSLFSSLMICFVICCSAEPVPLVVMDPELAIFLSRPLAMEFFTQNDQMPIFACQMTVQMIRLEEEQRRLRT